jgi:signal transduction histidine kinase/DNA-binding NarL/FixJ family response regulator
MAEAANTLTLEKPLRLLVIDDNVDDRTLAVRQLERDLPGVRIAVVVGPEELARALDQGAFDAVITDYQLRWSDGLAVLREAKGRYPERPVIMFTSTGTEEVAVEAMKSGLDDYIVKSRRSFVRLTPAVLAALERAAVRQRIVALEAQQAAMLAREHAARLEAERAREQLGFLVEAGAALSGSLDYTTTLSEVAMLAVPRICDWCALDMLTADGQLKRMAVAHSDPAKVAVAEELYERYPPDLAGTGGPWHVIRTGRPVIYPAIDDARLGTYARDAEHLALLRALGLRSIILAPLVARERVLGALTLAMADSGRGYGESDLDLAMTLGRRAALAIENAELYTKAQEAIRARDQFLAVASHELKTPLTSLWGHTELLARRLAQAEVRNPRINASVQAIANQGQRLSRLIATLLDLSQLQHGQLELSPAPLDLRALVEQVVAELQVELEQPRVEAALPETPVPVLGDALRLEQALINLIQNAIKYSAENAPIAVALVRRERFAELSVRDEGIGIPEAALPHVFTRFYRAPNVDSRHISGMGMGLFLVAEVVARHGGQVAVSSAEGRGSTFTITLPLAPTDPQPPEPIPALHEPASASKEDQR